jgi:hypothetical protein
MADPEPHLFDETVEFARIDLVENAPSTYHGLGLHAFHIVRLRLRARDTRFKIVPQGVESVIGFRAFVDHDAAILVTSIVADMRECVRDPFDVMRWVVPKGFAPYDLGLVSWLFPLEIGLRSYHGEPLIDVVVVTASAPGAAKLS